MRFLVRKRRSAPVIIIVALIDVLIVLVIFLLVTTTFKQQPALNLTLPESTSAVKSGASENPPLLVSLDKAGALRFGLDKLPVTLEDLQGPVGKTRTKNDHHGRSGHALVQHGQGHGRGGQGQDQKHQRRHQEHRQVVVRAAVCKRFLADAYLTNSSPIWTALSAAPLSS